MTEPIATEPGTMIEVRCPHAGCNRQWQHRVSLAHPYPEWCERCQRKMNRQAVAGAKSARASGRRPSQWKQHKVVLGR